MQIVKTTIDSRVVGYTLWLLASDTEKWAEKPGANWPCSKASGRVFKIVVDEQGLNATSLETTCFSIGSELEALVADHLPDDCKHLWPCWDMEQCS